MSLPFINLFYPWALYLVISHIRSCIFAQGWPQSIVFLPMASHVARITGTRHHAQFLGWDGVLFTICPNGIKPWPSPSLPPE
jgi:hypothetical protein